MRLDAHHHVWDLDVRPQPWIGPGEAPVIGRTFTRSDWAAAAAGTGVEAAVVVQTVPVAAETPELLDLAAADPHVLGVVGWIPGEGHPEDEIAALLAHPGARWLVGLRDLTQFRADRAWLGSDAARARSAASGAAGLAVDLLVEPDQIASATELVHRTPEVRYVLDHLGKPSLDAMPARDWGRLVAGLAEAPNVACKVSGTATLTADPDVPALPAYLAEAASRFGADRLMFGSDWPVMLLGGASYADQVRRVEDAARAVGLSDAEADALWGGTAARWYRLPAGGAA